MDIQYDFPLKNCNTFGVPATAKYYCRADSADAVRKALAWAGQRGVRTIVLGGGSNILFAGDPDALVLHMASRGVSVKELDSGRHLVSVAAGENWPDLVWWAVENGYGGIENLSMIPGTAGAAPVQNIGAYGVEFCDVCESVTALNRATGDIRVFSRPDCRFGYRDSIFKQQAEEWVVLGADLILDRAAPLRTGYGALEEKLAGRDRPNHADVARAVAAIRAEKLPAPEILGSAGSFFKNPVVPAAVCRSLRETHPDMPAFAQQDGTFKLSSAWLLDTAGWKQKTTPNVGCCPTQPLVLVNHGQATGEDILNFSRDIQDDMERRFGIRLEREVVIYP